MCLCRQDLIATSVAIDDSRNSKKKEKAHAVREIVIKRRRRLIREIVKRRRLGMVLYPTSN